MNANIMTYLAWQDHGCYHVGNKKFTNWDTWQPGGYDVGCLDDWNSLDHRDPAHPIRNIMKNMFELRTRYPVLNDGFNVQTLSKHTYPIYLPGSMGTATEMGLWSVLRSRWPGQSRNMVSNYSRLISRRIPRFYWTRARESEYMATISQRRSQQNVRIRLQR